MDFKNKDRIKCKSPSGVLGKSYCDKLCAGVFFIISCFIGECYLVIDMGGHNMLFYFGKEKRIAAFLIIKFTANWGGGVEGVFFEINFNFFKY